MKFLALTLLLITSTAQAAHQCQLPPDQGRGSLFGGWETLPVTLVLDQSFYLEEYGDDARAIKAAVQTWNNWAALQGKVAFVIANDGSGQEIPALTDCSQSSFTQSLRAGFVGIWKIDGSYHHENRRPSCGTDSNGTPGSLLPSGVQSQTDWAAQAGKITGASVLMNFSDYNAPGKQQLDTESIALHELGHVLGLLHSCNGSTAGSTDRTTAPACFTNGEATAPKAYLDAVMFPFLQPGEQRRTLMENDLDRMSCLY